MRWVLLRGLTREAAHWGAFPGQLAGRLGSNHTVQALDLPGSGALHGHRSPADVASIARVCAARAGGPVVLVAMSLGAMVALEWARAAPEDVAGCVLINTSAGGHSPAWDRLRPVHYGRVLRLLSGRLSPLQREHLVLEMTSSRPGEHATLAERWAGIATLRPVSRGNALRQLLAAARWRAPLAPPQASVLLLASRGDTLVAPRCTERLAAAWHLPVHWHPNAGHDLPLDDPGWVIEAIDRWRTAGGW